MQQLNQSAEVRGGEVSQRSRCRRGMDGKHPALTGGALGRLDEGARVFGIEQVFVLSS